MRIYLKTWHCPPTGAVPFVNNNHSWTGTDLLWKPEPSHQVAALRIPAVRVSPRGPAFHTGFPTANPKFSNQRQLFFAPNWWQTLISIAFGSSTSLFVASMFVMHWFPWISLCHMGLPLRFKGGPKSLLQKQKFHYQFWSVQKKPKNEKSGFLLFHIKTEHN